MTWGGCCTTRISARDFPSGLCLRTGDGKLAGMILSLPRLYKLGDRDLLGMAAGHFFVDASARMQGFFMLRRYLGTRRASTSTTPTRATASRPRSGPSVVPSRCRNPRSNTCSRFASVRSPRRWPSARASRMPCRPRPPSPDRLATLVDRAAVPKNPVSRSNTAPTSNVWPTSPTAAATPSFSSPTAPYPT